MGDGGPQILTRVPEITFRTRDASAPAPVYIGPGEHLFLQVRSSLAAGVIITGRLLEADGRISVFRFDKTPPADRSEVSSLLQLSEGFLLSVQASGVFSGFIRGTTWVTLTVRGSVLETDAPEQLLLQGYISQVERLCWPPGGYHWSTEGRGALRSITGTDPAAGAEISESVPTGARWRLQALSYLLITDATVANRFSTIAVDDGGGNIMWAAGANFTHAATVTERYSVGAAGFFGDTGSQKTVIALPVPMELRSGWRVRTVTDNLQAGDNYGAPQMLVEEWIEV